MTTYDRLIQEIVADPLDESPRLMLCDWLVEHGREAEAANLRRRTPWVACLSDVDPPAGLAGLHSETVVRSYTYPIGRNRHFFFKSKRGLEKLLKGIRQVVPRPPLMVMASFTLILENAKKFDFIENCGFGVSQNDKSIENVIPQSFCDCVKINMINHRYGENFPRTCGRSIIVADFKSWWSV